MIFYGESFKIRAGSRVLQNSQNWSIFTFVNTM